MDLYNDKTVDDYKTLPPYESFVSNSFKRGREKAPFYSNKADYNTNSKSYYDDLSRKQELIELLAKKLWYYDEEMAKRFKEWDDLIEAFPKNVEDLLIEWMKDGTLDDIINKNIFKDLNLEIDSIKAILIELKQKDVKQDKEINRIENKITSTESKLNDRLDHIISPAPIDVVETVAELKSKYPNGAKGVVVVKADGYYYYYQSGAWHKGGEYTGSAVYELVKTDGTVKNINNEEFWRNNPDITALNTGFYSAFVQSEKINANYPVGINFPKDIKGAECLIKVFKHDYDDRKDFEIVVNFSNATYTASKAYNDALTPWSVLVKTDSKNPIQQYRLTYYSGGIRSLFNLDGVINESNKLNMKITDLPTGFFYGQITDNNGALDRNLPDDIIYGAYYTIIVFRTDDNRVSINLHDNTGKRSWVCYSVINTQNIVWKRLDVETDVLEHDEHLFSYKANKLQSKHLKTLVITDTHIQHEANTNQIANINASNMEDFYKISDGIKNKDASLHLGDWIDGNFEKDNSINSMVKLSREFYNKPNHYGVYGNHDYNAQWDGFSGENGKYKYDMKRLFDKNDMMTYYTPKGKDYYYIDNNEKRNRMIFLNSFDISYKEKEPGILYLDPLQTRGFGSTQVRWLVNTLKKVPAGYNVTIFSHDTLNGVFDDASQYYNGDLVRKICEAYQNKEKIEVFTSGIDETSPVFDYYEIEENEDLTTSNGKILGVINGHRHIDKSISKRGIRYVSLLCARAEAGTTEEKPPRDYNNVTRNAISYLEFDTDKEVINIIRYGAGKDRTYKMFV